MTASIRLSVVVALLIGLLSTPAMASGTTGEGEVSAQLSESVPLINANRVHRELGITGQGVGVLVIDDFGSRTQDIAPHGMIVKRIIQAVAPGAEVIACGVGFLNEQGRVKLATGTIAPECLRNALKDPSLDHIRVVNMSYETDRGFSNACGNSIQALTPHNQLLSQLNRQGVVNVAASGNAGNPFGISSPACLPEVISVGAVYDGPILSELLTSPCPEPEVGERDKVTCYSNAAPILDVLAPGSRVIVEGNLGLNQWLEMGWGGTSWAAPHVSGVAALMMAANPDLSPEDVRRIIKRTGKPVMDTRNGQVFPRVDAYSAVKAAMRRSEDRAPTGTKTVSVEQIHADQAPLRKRVEVTLMVKAHQSMTAYTAMLSTDEGVTVLENKRFVQVNVAEGEVATMNTAISCLLPGEHAIESTIVSKGMEPVTTETTIGCASPNDGSTAPPSGPSTVADFDTNGNDFIDDTEMIEAIDAWLDDKITDSLFFDVMDAWTAQSRVSGSGLGNHVSYRIYNLDGQLVERMGCRYGRAQAMAQRTVNRSSVPAGAYVAAIENCRTGQVQTTKVYKLP